ncbi:MAG TPA: HTTM domain-containing protein [Haliangium sp.]|nr:HTTM domain-containing protein [Haliangium sp.]
MSKRVQRVRAPEPGATHRAPGVFGRATAAIHRFFEREIDPFVLGLYRASLGMYVLLYYVMLAPSWMFFHGMSGLTPIDRTGAISYDWLSPLFFHVRSDEAMWILYGVSVVSAILLALGVFWRVACLWLWQMDIGLMVGNPYVTNSEEQVMIILLLFALFMPLGASLTLPQLWSRERRRAMLCGDGATRVKAWAALGLQMHLMFVYLASLPDKLSDSAWRDGTVVYYAMMALDYPRWPGMEIFAWGNAALGRVMTLFAVATELLVPFFIWFRRWRVPCVLAAMSLHLGMTVLLEGVMMFNVAMIVGLVLFLPSRSTRLLVARVLRLCPPDSAARDSTSTSTAAP